MSQRKNLIFSRLYPTPGISMGSLSGHIKGEPTNNKFIIIQAPNNSMVIFFMDENIGQHILHGLGIIEAK